MISEIDSQRFGIRIAKKGLNSLDDLLQIEEYAKSNKIRMVIARGTAENLAVVQDAIRKGFILMDSHHERH